MSLGGSGVSIGGVGSLRVVPENMPNLPQKGKESSSNLAVFSGDIRSF